MDTTKIKKAEKAVEYIFKNKKAENAVKKGIARPCEHLWLISERGDDAQDNGFHLYKYLLEHPEANIHPAYVIDPLSSDYNKVKALGGQVISRGSDYHYIAMYQADALISTHTYGYTPDKNIYYRLAQRGMFSPKGAIIFLSHGVTDKDMSWLYRKNFKPDMFVTSCKAEYELVRNRYGQPERVVKPIGLCRYDALYQAPEPKKQILIMPTWRVWLNKMTDEEFKQTTYYIYWKGLLEDKTFKDKVISQGYKIIFYLHPEIKKRIHLFEFENIEVEDRNLQQIMIESELLVTDYSSVFSDMAYMGRKIVFYQFDKTDYATKHYEGLIAPYEKFGEIIDSTKESAGETILRTLSSPNKADENYIQNDYFINHDNKCCERTVDRIKLVSALKKQMTF